METPGDPTPAAPVAPAAPAVERPRRTTRRARRGWKTWAIFGVAAAAFGAFAVWLSNQDPPAVTHAEAMTMAALIEQAKTVEQLGRLCDPDLAAPTDLVASLDERFPRTAIGMICQLKEIASYTFVHVAKHDDGIRHLLFRVHTGTLLIDYHELRLERRDGAPRVTNLWSMACGRDVRAIAAMRQQPTETQREAMAFAARMAAGEGPQQLLEDYDRLPAAVRSERLLSAFALKLVAEHRPGELLRVFNELHAADPEHLGPDIVLLLRPVEPGPLRTAVRDALQRMRDRVGDLGFLDQVWQRLTR